MLARPISRRAAGAIRSSLPSSSSSSHLAACRTNGVRHFSTPIVEKPRAHRTAGGQNSLVVGSAVLGATIVAGYIFGRGETLDKKTIEKTASNVKKVAAKAPEKIKEKAQEAREAVSSTASTVKSKAKSATASSTPPASTSTSTSSSSSSRSPAVSSTGATEPLPSVTENEHNDAASIISSSQSDPGSISDSLAEIASEAEEEAEEDPRQAAFNPETGEINWDCPCLGGMAHGICGEQFREAFSCFIYSEVEPKGQDCIDKFRNMQDCFAANPEVYGEVMGDDEEDDAPLDESEYDIISAVESALTSDSK